MGGEFGDEEEGNGRGGGLEELGDEEEGKGTEGGR